MRCKIFILVLMGIFLVNSVSAISDVAVFQGQYYDETSFIQGTFEFTFDIYDDRTAGNLVGSYKTNLTTGTWGQWKVEVPGVSAASNDTSKDYFIEISIDGVPQLPRRRLTHFNYLRKDVDEITSGSFTSTDKIISGGYSYYPLTHTYARFTDPSGNDVVHLVPKGDLLTASNVTSVYLSRNNINYVGMSHFELFGNRSFVWTDTRNGNSGFIIIDTLNKSNDTKIKFQGVFTDQRLSLGGFDPFNPDIDSSAGMQFIIYKDASGTKAFFVDPLNGYMTTINAVLNVTDIAYFDNAYVNGTAICLEDGTNCQIQNISFSENDTLQSVTDRDAVTTNNITIGNVLNFIFGGFIQEFSNRFLVSKSLEVSGNLNVTGDINSNGKLVCLEDGTNCQTSSGGSSVQYVRFISTVDGKLSKNDRYLALGTDGGISMSVTEMAWIIDRDMTITGILWDSKSNSRTKTSAITLMSGNNKNSLSDTSLSKDIQGIVSGADLTFNVSLSQGDAVAIKYDSGGSGGDVEDLSITLIGKYD